MKIIGYGICGPGESKRYLRETLEEFRRLCDEVIILINEPSNLGSADECTMVDRYGFKTVTDHREWGKYQWKIKEDFLKFHVNKIAEEGDMMICLDMDETFDKHLTRQWLQEAPLDAYHVFVVDLWNDPQHYKPESCFWNVRIWRWNDNLKFKEKPVHCGLAPEWAYHYHRHAPFILKHKGLMTKESRQRKIARYEKYDPNAKHLERRYYDMLKSDTAKPFDEEELHATIAKEVASYKQVAPRGPQIYMSKPKEKFFYLRNPAGNTVDVPEKHLAQTLKRPGFTLIGPADDVEEEMEALFKDQEVLDEAAEQGMLPDKPIDTTELTPEAQEDVAEIEDAKIEARLNKIS